MLRVLHLEDSPKDAALISGNLRREGLDAELLRVETQEQFELELRSKSYDIIIADYNLPLFDGLTALKIAQAIQPEIPFIFVSGALSAELAVETIKRGATDYVLKDRLERLVSSIQRAIREKADRDALRASQALLRQITDSVPALISYLDRDGRYVLNNRAYEHWFGKDRSRITGRHMSEVLGSAAFEQIKPRFERAVSGLETAYEDHLQYQDGGSRWVSAVYTPHIGRDGKVCGVVALVSDITKRKEAEEELRRAKTAAEDANRAKDEFLATLSHELRTPLTPMLGWTRMLLGGTLDAARVQQGLQAIERNVRAQTQLIEDILDISRIVMGKLRLTPRDLELKELINTCVESLRPGFEAKGLQVEVTTPERIWMSADADRLQQIVWNLLSNAVKFTPQNGRIWLQAIRMSDHVEIQVSDTGKGISPNFLPHLFTRFRQQDGSSIRKHGGLGIGLSLVKHLTELHGGTVRAESAGAGKGATFIVTLPVSSALQETSIPASNSVASFEGLDESSDRRLRNLRILVVDDESDTRDLLRAILEEQAADVVTASSVIDAVLKYEQFRPDIVVTDIGMPEEDGFALIQKLGRIEAARGQKPLAIALTAYARDEDKARCADAGFQQHLAKPIDPVELVSKITVIARRR